MDAGRYIVADYKKAGDTTPRIGFRTDDLPQAEVNFKLSAERAVRSVVLFDTKTDTVLKIALDKEPIYHVEAIEKARSRMDPEAIVDLVIKTAAKKAAEVLIGKMIKVLTGKSDPGLGGVVVAMFMVGYYASKRDGGKAAGAAVGPLGAQCGAALGEKMAGKIGSHVGDFVGGATAEAAGEALYNYIFPPSKKLCTTCKGIGLDGNARRCRNCKGKGYP